MKRSILLFPAILLCGTLRASSACGGLEHAAFDFWVGEWNVTNAAGAPSGTSRVEKILNGCVIVENWTSTKGGYEGKSFNTLDPAHGTWSQYWVDNAGLSALMTGSFQGKNLIYRRELTRKDGTPAMSRMTFFDIEPGKVRQLVEQSTDGGKTWTTQFDMRYARR